MKTIYLSFDLEDWFHRLDHPIGRQMEKWDQLESNIYDNISLLLDLLSHYQLKASFFCLGWMADRYPSVIRRIQSQGHLIGTHGYAHLSPQNCSTQAFRKDLRLSINVLEDICGETVNAYRAPGFHLRLNQSHLFEILIEEGIRIDASIAQSQHLHQTSNLDRPFTIYTPSGTIMEYPLPCNKLGLNYSGGTYFKTYPLALIHYWSRNKAYQMFYFHPRECNSSPINRFSVYSKAYWKQQIGSNSCQQKLIALFYLLSIGQFSRGASLQLPRCNEYDKSINTYPGL